MESPPQKPNYLLPPTISSVEPQQQPSAHPPPPTPLTQPTTNSDTTAGIPLFSFPRRPAVRLTTEFDSDSSIFFHKVSCKFFDSLAKFKLTFHNNSKGEVSEPQLSFISKNLSIHYDIEEQSTFVKSSFDVGPRLHFSAAHDVKSQQGEVAMVARIADPGYSFQLCSAFPSVGLPKATFKFPLGEVSLEETERKEVSKKVSVDGILKGQLLNGICTAHYKDEALNLRYSYKDEEMSFIPTVSLPSNALSFALKRQFGPSDKLRSCFPWTG